MNTFMNFLIDIKNKYFTRPIIDYTEMLEFIERKTGIDSDTIEEILHAEEDFLASKGLINC